jgi:hypothetical protein
MEVMVKKTVLLVMVIFLGCSAFSQTEKIKSVLQLNYEKSRTEARFVSYVDFLIYHGREQCKSEWLDEAWELLNEHKWNSAERKVKVLREYHMSRAAFLSVPERMKYLKKVEKEVPIDGNDSFSIILADAEHQMRAYKDGEQSDVVLLLSARQEFLREELEFCLNYLNSLLDYGESVYFTDSIYKSKLEEIISRLNDNPLAQLDSRYCFASLRVDLIFEQFEDALAKIDRLRELDATGLETSALNRLGSKLLLKYDHGSLNEKRSYSSDPLSRLHDLVWQEKAGSVKGGSPSNGVSPLNSSLDPTPVSKR